MGFFDQDNEKLETVWFSVLAALSLLCFPFGVRLGQRFPQIPAAKFVPVLCLLLAYENVVQALSNVLANDSLFVLVARATRAAVIPMFLVVMFEVAYAVHKRRSVKFCGIVFDQGHRRSVEPCSWFLRNFVRIVAVMILVVGVLVNYDIIVGDDEKAGGTGLVETEDASTHLLLALLPTTGMALIALYIAVYMWKYGNDASIVVQSTICNGWILLFLGTLALLAGQVPPEWCFRVANESGQVLLLLALIAIGREIGREVQAADDFSSFLEKENELESGSGSNSMSSITPGAQNPKPIGLAPPATRRAMEAEPDSFAAAFVFKEEEEVTGVGSRGKHDPGAPGRSGIGKESGGVGAKEEEVIREHDRSLDDVTRPMEWHMGRPNGGAGNGRPISVIFSKKRPTRTEDHGGGFAGLSESEEERDSRRDSQRDEAQVGVGQRSSAVSGSDGHARGASDMFSSTSSAAAPAVVAVAAEGDKNGSGVVRLAIRSKHVNAV